MNKLFFSLLLILLSTTLFAQRRERPKMNIIFILADDHRYDAMGFMGKIPGLQTPGMDQLAAEGAHLSNAFVSTSLCSPSRASILTGQYAHTHRIVDNSTAMPADMKFFPQYLQQAGYQTAFLGKWHMGHGDDMPQPGFDYWLSFQGQGVYNDPVFNVNGKRIKQPKDSYTTDLLTDSAVHWMQTRNPDRPFFLYLSHKGVHAEFYPAKRHEGKYSDVPVVCPPSMYLTATDSSRTYGRMTAPTTPVNFRDIPDWVRAQRYSWHGVDYMYHGQIPFDVFYRRYLETLQSVDESVQRVLNWVKAEGLANNTMIVYMGDNGFSFGEHGLIDKRHAYEESMRVPLLLWAPGMVKPHSVVDQVIMNVDLAPSFLELAGLKKPAQMEGFSFVKLLQGEKDSWKRDKVYYEYYWESAFPQTPTTFAIRTDQYKYIFYQGVWGINELYDLKADPYEMNNLIRDTSYRKNGLELKKDLFDWLLNSGGENIPLKAPVQIRFDNLYMRSY